MKAAVHYCALGGFCAALVFSAAGCQMPHDLQPHRLQRLNRGKGLTSGFEAYYSVRDPIPDKWKQETISR